MVNGRNNLCVVVPPPPGFTPRGSTVTDTPLHALLLNLMTSEEYVCDFKEMMEELDPGELETMGSLVTSDSDYFTEIVGNKYGSSHVEKLLGKSDVVDEFLCGAIVCSFLHIMTEKYASQVAVRAMVVFEEEKKKTLYGHTLHHALDLARDQYGCIALKEIISINDAYLRDEILDVVALNALSLSNDAWGNFVVQHAIDLRCTHNILVSLRGHYVELSFQRYGSYIVEKLLEEREEPMVEVVMELLDCHGYWLMMLARSEFGNFVVSKALELTKEEMDTASLFFALVRKLVPFLPFLRNSHGSSIADTLESIVTILNSIRFG